MIVLAISRMDGQGSFFSQVDNRIPKLNELPSDALSADVCNKYPLFGIRLIRLTAILVK